MDLGLYSNSYLKQFEAKQNYKTNKMLKSKPIADFINNKMISQDNKMINQDNVQHHKNYLDSKHGIQKPTQLVNSTNKKPIPLVNYINKKPTDYNNHIKKEGYLSRAEKEKTLYNKSVHGYEALKKFKNFDVVSISRPIYWPERGYNELSEFKSKNKFKTYYFKN